MFMQIYYIYCHMKDTVLYTKDVAMNKADMTPALMGPILIHGPLQVWSCFQGEKKNEHQLNL